MIAIWILIGILMVLFMIFLITKLLRFAFVVGVIILLIFIGFYIWNIYFAESDCTGSNCSDNTSNDSSDLKSDFMRTAHLSANLTEFNFLFNSLQYVFRIV